MFCWSKNYSQLLLFDIHRSGWKRSSELSGGTERRWRRWRPRRAALSTPTSPRGSSGSPTARTEAGSSTLTPGATGKPSKLKSGTCAQTSTQKTSSLVVCFKRHLHNRTNTHFYREQLKVLIMTRAFFPQLSRLFHLKCSMVK